MPSNPTVRAGTLDDLEVIARFNIAMARESEHVELHPPTVRAGVRAALLDGAKGRYLVAERNGEVVGQLMTTAEWSDWRNGTFLWIQSVYVDPAQRGHGVFRALYREIERQAAQPGMCGARLYVHDDNTAAVETYRRLGMVVPGYTLMETPDELKA